jgi:hypothetical protein
VAFVPQNPLEDALLRAQTDVPAREEFYDRLRDEMLFVPGDCGRAADGGDAPTASAMDTLTVPVIRINGRQYYPIFSSIERLKTYRDTSFFIIRGADVFQNKNGAEFLLNPGSDIGKVMTRDEVAYCLAPSGSRKAQVKERRVYWREPAEYPQKLVEALRVFFANRADVASAHLLEVSFSERSEPPHPMIGIEVTGDWRKTFSEVTQITEALLPDVIVDVIPLNREKPMDELATALLKTAPFYMRDNTKLN